MRFSHLLLSATLALSGVVLPAAAFAGNTGKTDTGKGDTGKHEEKNEKVVQLKDLPKPAQDTVRREAKGGKLLKVEQMTKDGSTVYEATIRKGKDETGVVVDAKGAVVERHSEKSEKGEQH